MADDKPVSNVGDIPASGNPTPDADKAGDKKGASNGDGSSKSKVVKNDDGSPKLDFLTADEATAQAKAIGGKASVENVGVAYRVNTGKE